MTSTPQGAASGGAMRFVPAAQSLLILALAVPFLWPFDPGPNAKNGAMLLAAALWSLFALSGAAAGWVPRAGAVVWGFVGLAAVVAAQSVGRMLAYPSVGWLGVALLLGAAVTAGLGLRLSRNPAWLALASAALLAQGLAEVAIGLLQFAMWQEPRASQWLAGHAGWVFNIVSYPGDGRVYGNLRQPNHYATAVALGLAGLAGLAPRLSPRQVLAAAVALTWALVVSGSRTAAIHAALVCAGVLLAVPGSWRSRNWLPLLATPALFAGWWLLMDVAGHRHWIVWLDAVTRQLQQPVDARGIIWRDAWEIFRMRPLTGWGWEQITWAMERGSALGWLHPLPIDNVDNAHDLFLQLLDGVGLVGTAPVVVALLVWGWRVLRPWRAGPAGAARRVALLPGLLAAGFIGLHSLLEYPMWYIYFLFAFAFAMGWAEGAAGEAVQRASAAGPAWARARWLGVAAGAVLLALTARATFDYWRASEVYDTDDDATAQLRVAAASHNWFYVPLAEFSTAAGLDLSADTPPAVLEEQLALLERASHVWGDPELLNRRMVLLLLLHRPDEAVALARYTANAFWLYAQRTASDFQELADDAGLSGDPEVARVAATLRAAPVLRRIVVPRKTS